MTSTDVLAVVDATARVERRSNLRPSVTKYALDPGTNLMKLEGRLPFMHKSHQNDSGATESDRFEVQSLSDVVPTMAVGTSKIAERIKESRRPRHDQALDDMKHELGRITAELEPRIHQVSDNLKQQLIEEGKAVEELMSKAGTKKCLQSLSLVQLEELWSSVAQHTPSRQRCLQVFEEALDKIECDRCSMVTEVISHYGDVLQAIAYLLPEEVTKLMEDTAHAINLSLIANKKSYAALVRHLMIVELMKERELHEQWEAIVCEWKEEVCSDVTSKFRSYMESDAVRDPPELQKVKALLKAEQTAVTRQREELLNQFSAMKPPKATKLAIYEWNEKVLRLQHQLEHVHNTYLVQLQQCSEAAVQRCQQEMEKCKCFLMDSQACAGSTIYEVLNKHFVPPVEAYSTLLREQLQAAERSLDLVLGSQQAQFQALFQYAQGAASLWDSHVDAKDNTQRQHQDVLVKLRAQHDLENQNLEANLDIILDRLRQCSAKEALAGYLQEAHRLLSVIKEGYTNFHSHMLTEISKLKPLIREGLESYDSSLCKYLGVARHPAKGRKSKGQATKASYVSPSPHTSSRDSRRGARSRASTQSRATSVTSSSPSPLTSIVEEVIATSHGTSFYVQSLIEDTHLGPAIFLTQDEESEGMAGTFATEGLSISEEAFLCARNQLRASFLDQLEAWKVELTRRAEETVAGKLEETHTELDIRMHLHSPRLGRVDDIGHTRGAELVAHKDRVLRHSNAVLHELDETKSLVESLSDQQNKLMEQCTAELQTMEKSFHSADRLNSLKAMGAKLDELALKVCLNGYVFMFNPVATQHSDMLKTLGTAHLKTIQDVMADLLSSNNGFRASLKPFSEGGNYSQEEIEGFSRKMNKLSAKIEGVQASVSKEVLALTEVGQTQTQETVVLVKSHLQAHIMDVSFLEAISSALANAQVKIKSEVAVSNGQSQSISQLVQNLQVLVKQCDPVPGLERTEPSVLLAELPKVLDFFSTRVEYLCCKAHQRSRTGPDSEVPKGGTYSQSQGPISAVNITRSIMEAVTTKKRMDPEVELPPSHARHAKNSGSQTVLDTQPTAACKEGSGHKPESALHKRKQMAVERKNISFGSTGDEDGSDCRRFLPNIRAILVDVHTQLFQMAEVFYKQKGSRSVTRPDQLKETFELCMDHLTQRCQSYRTQAEEYRNDCIGELHEQLEQLMSTLEQVPLVVFSGVRRECQAKADKEWKAELDARLQKLEESSKAAASHVTSLCPAMGHPCQRQTLEQLCVAEQERHAKALETIKNNASALKVLGLAHAKVFILNLHATTKNLIDCVDLVTCPYDIVHGGKRLKPKQTVSQLIRESRQSQPATTEGISVFSSCPTCYLLATVSADAGSDTNNSNTAWPGLSKTELMTLLGFNDTEAFAITETLTSQKSSPIHHCVIKARDSVFQDYAVSLTDQLQSVSQSEQMESNKEEKRFDYWLQSVQRVKDLYKVLK
ncbi:hypothetical protein EMCRGX_G021038 [Ephydatia muelleri]